MYSEDKPAEEAAAAPPAELAPPQPADADAEAPAPPADADAAAVTADAPAEPEDPNAFSVTLRDLEKPPPKVAEGEEPPPEKPPVVILYDGEQDRAVALAIDRALRSNLRVASCVRTDLGEEVNEKVWKALLHGALSKSAALLVVLGEGAAEAPAAVKEVLALAAEVKPAPPPIIPVALVPSAAPAVPAGVPEGSLELLPALGSAAFGPAAATLALLLEKGAKKKPAKTADGARALALEEALEKMHAQHVETEGARARLEMENQVLKRNADNNRERQEAAEKDANKWKQEAKSLAEQVEPTKQELARTKKEMAAMQSKLADMEGRLRSMGVDVKQISARDQKPSGSGAPQKSSACLVM